MNGWEEANVNELTGLEHLDPLSGFPWLRAFPARVEKECTDSMNDPCLR